MAVAVALVVLVLGSLAIVVPTHTNTLGWVTRQAAGLAILSFLLALSFVAAMSRGRRR